MGTQPPLDASSYSVSIDLVNSSFYETNIQLMGENGLTTPQWTVTNNESQVTALWSSLDIGKPQMIFLTTPANSYYDVNFFVDKIMVQTQSGSQVYSGVWELDICGGGGGTITCRRAQKRNLLFDSPYRCFGLCTTSIKCAQLNLNLT